VRYDASYRLLPFPGGDVPTDRGACTDVIVRALRAAGHDIQALVGRDRRAAPDAYPVLGGSLRPDASIDHRRCPNQRVFFRRHGADLPPSVAGSARGDWKPGDLVYWKLDGGRDHRGAVTDLRAADGRSHVIHNLGGAREEPCLARWKITAHFRYPAPRR
jgi:hypothetical protein